MRRVLLLGVLAAGAGGLLWVVREPAIRPAADAVSGPRLCRIAPAAVERVRIAVGDRRVEAERRNGRWRVDGRDAPPPLGDALDALVALVCSLRAVDRFRPADGAGFGLDAPHGTIEVASAARRMRLALGDLNAARSAVYARRDDRPHVLLVGVGLVSALERVFYFAAGPAAVRDAPAA